MQLNPQTNRSLKDHTRWQVSATVSLPCKSSRGILSTSRSVPALMIAYDGSLAKTCVLLTSAQVRMVPRKLNTQKLSFNTFNPISNGERRDLKSPP